MKQERTPLKLRPNQPNNSIDAPVGVDHTATAESLTRASSGEFLSANSALRSWLNAERILHIWTAIVVACVVWQPFVLGFYYDDWDLWVNGSTKGAPFSLARLVFMNNTNPVRVGCLPGRFLGSSLFGAHPQLWHGALLLVNCVIALSIVAAGRALIQARTPEAKTITAAAGLCWLLLPWNGAAQFWTALLPNTLMVAVLACLCVLLIHGWAKNQSRVISAGTLYFWTCVSYEAFYLQWITITLIGVILWRAKRTQLRPVAISAAALVGAQVLAGLWNLYTKSRGDWTAMSVLPDWPQSARRALFSVVPAMGVSVAEILPGMLLCAVVVFAFWFAAHVRSLSRPSDRSAGYTSSLVAGVCIFGGLMSVVIFSLAGRRVAGTGVDSRPLMVFNFWLIIAATTLVAFAMERLRGAPKVVFSCALAGLGICLAVGQVLRASDWVTAWDLQKKILAEAPISEMKRTEKDARIVLVNPMDVNGAPVFAAEWDINNAIAWAYPFLQSRRFIVYNKWVGQMKWDGSQLSYVGQPPLATTAVYLWRPLDMTFWRPSGPFVINQNLSVEPKQ